jgi:hypothetical protein
VIYTKIFVKYRISSIWVNPGLKERKMAIVYKCVKLDNHEDIAGVTMEYTANGWSLHTYQAAGHYRMGGVLHFLLFSRDAKGK